MAKTHSFAVTTPGSNGHEKTSTPSRSTHGKQPPVP
jgi:hypothetical protein